MPPCSGFDSRALCRTELLESARIDAEANRYRAVMAQRSKWPNNRGATARGDIAQAVAASSKLRLPDTSRARRASAYGGRAMNDPARQNGILPTRPGSSRLSRLGKVFGETALSFAHDFQAQPIIERPERRQL